jgi:hypothetical protein
MTLGFVRRELEDVKIRIQKLESSGQWKGDERRENDFSDKQTDKLKEIFDERAETFADRAFNRLILWAAISAFAGGASVVLAYFKLKGV